MRTGKTGQILRLAGSVTAITVSGLSIAPAAHAAASHVVHPGESIQKAVDQAKPGDTILIEAGTYHESVNIAKDDLTISGAGPNTVLTPGKADSAHACAKLGHGMCVTGTADNKATDVTIQALTVSGFPKSGIMGSQTDRMTVHAVLAQKNGEHGIGQEHSTRGVLSDNEAKDNGRSGIFLATVPDAQKAAITGNRVSGSPSGVLVHSASQLTIEDNVLTGNCGGLFVLDGQEPRSKQLTIRRNLAFANNKACPAQGRAPYSKGSGIVLVGVEDSVVDDNLVWNNQGDARQSGGIVLSKSFDSGHASANNVVSGNVSLDNKPVDLAAPGAAPAGQGAAGGTGNQGVAGGGAGQGAAGGGTNQFTGNSCGSATPAGLCG